MNYYGIWKSFNKFFLRLDQKPTSWEDRITLFVAHLVDSNRKSTTIKSYISAIKSELWDIGVELSTDDTLLGSLTRACKLRNDHVCMRMPIRHSLLMVLLATLDRRFRSPQPYLRILYKALLATTYFGLFRVGEVTLSKHVIKAVDVHVGINKNKLLFMLHSSKTHNHGMKPQIIKIAEEPAKTLTQ